MIDAAKELAKYSEANNYKLGCIITDKRGNILSSGINKPSKSHPLQAKWAKKAGEPKRIYLHAELDALIKCKHNSPHTLYVARVRKNGGNANSTPCNICMTAIIDAGIKEIVYFDAHGKIKTKKL